MTNLTLGRPELALRAAKRLESAPPIMSLAALAASFPTTDRIGWDPTQDDRLLDHATYDDPRSESSSTSTSTSPSLLMVHVPSRRGGSLSSAGPLLIVSTHEAAMGVWAVLQELSDDTVPWHARDVDWAVVTSLNDVNFLFTNDFGMRAGRYAEALVLDISPDRGGGHELEVLGGDGAWLPNSDLVYLVRRTSRAATTSTMWSSALEAALVTAAGIARGPHETLRGAQVDAVTVRLPTTVAVAEFLALILRPLNHLEELLHHGLDLYAPLTSSPNELLTVGALLVPLALAVGGLVLLSVHARAAAITVAKEPPRTSPPLIAISKTTATTDPTSASASASASSSSSASCPTSVSSFSSAQVQLPGVAVVVAVLVMVALPTLTLLRALFLQGTHNLTRAITSLVPWTDEWWSSEHITGSTALVVAHIAAREVTRRLLRARDGVTRSGCVFLTLWLAGVGCTACFFVNWALAWLVAWLIGVLAFGTGMRPSGTVSERWKGETIRHRGFVAPRVLSHLSAALVWAVLSPGAVLVLLSHISRMPIRALLGDSVRRGTALVPMLGGVLLPAWAVLVSTASMGVPDSPPKGLGGNRGRL